MTDTDWTQDVAAQPAPGDDIGLAFASLPEFVERFFLEVCVRHEVTKWCPKWWDHEEAVLRLEALWDAFEALRREPGTGTATWIRDYLDPTVAALTSAETTPFRKCDARRGEHIARESLAADPPPPGMFVTIPAATSDSAEGQADIPPDPQE